MNGQGGAASFKGYVVDWGFWAAVVVVSVGVNLAFHILKLPGSRS